MSLEAEERRRLREKVFALFEPEQASPGRGRPRRSEVERYRARTWAVAVIETSGCKPAALDEAFGSPGSGQWVKYEKGLSSPGPDRVREVEAAYPGTAWYFNSLLWRSIRPESFGSLNPRALFENMPEPLHSRFVISGSRSSLFWRRRTKLPNDLRWLLNGAKARMSPFDVMAGLVALTHEALLVQDRDGLAACVDGLGSLCDFMTYDLDTSQGLAAALPETLLASFGRHVFRLMSGHPRLRDSSSPARRIFGR